MASYVCGHKTRRSYPDGTPKPVLVCDRKFSSRRKLLAHKRQAHGVGRELRGPVY